MAGAGATLLPRHGHRTRDAYHRSDRVTNRMSPERYLERLGVDHPLSPTLETLATLQRTHVNTVPFETLAITGDPWRDRSGSGISLDIDDLLAKIVRDGRGGFCYELNEAFRWLLDELGFDVTRLAAAVLVDGEPCPPANHLFSLVTLDRPYLADVGLGGCPMRVPLPLDGAVREDQAGIHWRVSECARPDAAYVTQYRFGDDDWTDRYVFDAVPRDLDYVRATCEYLATAPESGFTGDPILTIGTPDGYAKLTTEQFTQYVAGEEYTRSIEPAEWDALVADQFGLAYETA